MRMASIGLAVLLASLGAGAPVLAQHDGHDANAAATPGVSSPLVSQCVESQQQSLGLVDGANARLENARQSNSPAEIRAAMADLQRVLLDLRTVLARCTELQQALAAAPPAAPAPGPGATPQPAGHMVMVQTAFDPAKLTCSPKIDPKTAAKATYEGKTYYFCSGKDRDEFLTDPKMSLSMMPPKQ